MSHFRLDKWYFDCVSPDGALLIGYAARLEWGPIGFSYGARITKAKNGPACQRQSRSFGWVEEEHGCVHWGNTALGVAGRWIGGQKFDNMVLFNGTAGSIEWQCLGANSEVSVHVDGETMEGLGYVERISMTVPPWRLPFKELRWGRYISDDRKDYAVWIDMRGELQRNWTWMGENTAVNGAVEDTIVRTDSGQLLFEASQPIRCENVVGTILGRFRFLAKALPRGVWMIQENKQLSSCILKTASSESKGMSVNEVVKWL